MKLSTKIIIVVTVMIISSVLIISGVTIAENFAYNEQTGYDRISSASEDLEYRIDQLLEKSEQNAVSISQNYYLIDAIENNSFNQMQEALDELNTYLKADTISIADANGDVLIRQHSPEKYGDSILEQSNVQNALNGKIATTIEPGALVKLSCRTGAPIRGEGGEIIGTVVTGYTFENPAMVDDLKEIHGTELTIFSGKERISTTLIQDGERMIGTEMSDDIAKVVLENQQPYVGQADILGTSHMTIYTPLRDTEGNVVGAIFAGLSQEAIRQATWTTVSHLAIISVLIIVVCMVILILFTNKSIKRPMYTLTDVATRLAQGNLDVGINVSSSGRKDEIATLTAAMMQMTSQLKLYITDISEHLSYMANKDFSIQSAVHYAGDFAPIESSLKKISSSLNDTLSFINLAAEQVATGSSQVSSAAQALASGSTEQAATVQELNASAEQIVSQAEENLSTVTTASKSVEQSGINIVDSNEHMAQLTQAMSDISSASDQIVKITKVIEDISFQTNILALNASVEAARAGNAGSGFAVVADEVRNLAAKSAEAARQTSQLIQTSVEAVGRGAQLTGQTAQLLQDVSTSTTEVQDSFERMNQSITEQAQAIERIREGISQISTVVQTNAATAEENSATSEEMSAQADTLRHEIRTFKLLDVNSAKRADHLPLGEDAAMPERSNTIDEDGWGKY